MSSGGWYKNKATDLVWWLDTSDRVGEWIFSFDREYPEWAEFFKDRAGKPQEGG